MNIQLKNNVFGYQRAQEGTPAAAFPALSRVEARITAQTIYDAIGDAVAGSGAPGAGGGGGSYGLFYKTDSTTVAFIKTGNNTASIKAGAKVDVSGTLVEFAADTAVGMPPLMAGTDYAIWVKDDATIQASPNFTSPPAAGNWRKIGGFHYAPGGDAARIEWEFSSTVDRHSALVLSLASALGLTDAQLDVLFQQAAVL